VEGVRNDLEDSGGPVRLSIDVIEQAILEAASSGSLGKPLEYLLGCWKRVTKVLRGIQNKSDPKFDIVKEARRLCFSYCIFAATMPDMFGQDSTSVNPLVEYFLTDSESDRGICHEFLSEAVSRLNEDETVKEVLVSAMEQLSAQLAKMTMNDDYTPYMAVSQNPVVRNTSEANSSGSEKLRAVSAIACNFDAIPFVFTG